MSSGKQTNRAIKAKALGKYRLRSHLLGGDSRLLTEGQEGFISVSSGKQTNRAIKAKALGKYRLRSQGAGLNRDVFWDRLENRGQ